jgi:hypothetical protein
MSGILLYMSIDTFQQHYMWVEKKSAIIIRCKVSLQSHHSYSIYGRIMR